MSNIKFPGTDLRPTVEPQAGDLAPAAEVTTGNAVHHVFPICGSARCKARILTSGAGDLDLAVGYLDGTTGDFTAYTTGQPAQVAVTGGTEAQISTDLYGENHVRVTFTPGGDGTITRLHFHQV